MTKQTSFLRDVPFLPVGAYFPVPKLSVVHSLVITKILATTTVRLPDGRSQRSRNTERTRFLSDVTNSSPPAGWYSDPDGRSGERWWDGAVWTDHRQSTASITPPSVPAPADDSLPPNDSPAGFHNFYDASQDRKRGKNTFATNALVLGIFSVIATPFVPLRWVPVLMAVAAIVWGVLGIRRSQSSGLGKARAIWGLVLGSIALPVAIAVWGITSAPLHAESVVFDQVGVQAKITADAAAQGIQISDVNCPIRPLLTSGEEFRCLAKAADGSNTSVTISVRDSAGSMVWKIFDRLGVQQQIITGSAAQGTTLSSVSCPAAPSMHSGDHFRCVATAGDGLSTFVDVTWQDEVGSIVWQIG